MVRFEIPSKKVGTCDMCGEHNREIRLTALTEQIEWICEDCNKILVDSFWGRSRQEQTEPAE